jgi:hypothetical protein
MDGNWVSEDTSGFYKWEDPILLCGKNFVIDAEYSLFREEIDEYKRINFLPIDGWHWFDSREEALSFFGIKE